MIRSMPWYVAVSLALGLAATTARAEATGGWAVRLGSGISVATGDFGLAWGTGAPVAVSIGAGVTPRLEIGADVAYQTMDPSIAGTIFNDIVFDQQPELAMWRIGARARYALGRSGSRWIPHLLGGVALHPTKIEVPLYDGTLRTFRHTGRGVSGGAGLDCRLSDRWALGMESVYYWVHSDREKTEQKTTPYLDFNLGLRWMLGGG